MFSQSADRFTEIVQGMKQMAGEMQQELETTRAEMRRGILELPQETADSAAQMRRVIVDQIEALAELNRIVARHGRSLDTSEPARREAEPMLAIGGGRAQVARPPPPPRADLGPSPRADLAAAAAAGRASRHHRRADAPERAAARGQRPHAGRQGRRQRPQRRLAQRYSDARLARR